MTPETTEITPERLDAVEAELARLREADKQRALDEERRLNATLPAPPRLTESASELLAKQEAARLKRVEARAEWEKLYAAQLERTAPERERLQEELRDLETEMGAEHARHEKARDGLGVAIEKCRGKLQTLEAVPPMPVERFAADRTRIT